MSAPTPPDDLNPEQRRAVEHGVRGPVSGPGSPLLVIAGAGSGKTKTLAHRVAHLIVNGADPRRILLLTFSRRAAAEMIRRVERICRKTMGSGAAPMIDALDWAGTFHAVGARLLRDYAEEIGLDPAFTIHDREDAADLMNLARHELGLSKTETRFPTKGTCLVIYSRCVNAELGLEAVLGSAFPWCGAWAAELRRLFAAYVEAKQNQAVLDYDDLLLYWAQMAADPALAADLGGRFDHVLVDEYQDTNRLQASILLAIKPTGRGTDRRGRRCPIDLFVQGRDNPQHPRLPHPLQSPGRDHHARPQLSLDARHPGGRQCGDRPGGGAVCQDAAERADRRETPRPHRGTGRGRPGTVRRRARARGARERCGAQTPGRPVPNLAP